jgi:AraC-like DNA-binding protein
MADINTITEIPGKKNSLESTLKYVIKNGLYCSIKKVFIEQENSSFLMRDSEKVAMTFHFSESGCGLAFADMPVSYDMEFVFNLEYLKNFSSSDDFDWNQFPEFQYHEVCCTTQMILHDIINCKLQGMFRNMFIESKALALLLCFQKCNIQAQPDCASCKFLNKPLEKDKIVKAKEILLSRLNNPPTIPELSMQIGTNQCYLKKGFKELFGTTVHDFIQEQRMLKAKLLLTTTDHSVSEVAEEIGFSSVSNFSSAFKRLTGVFPSELQKN